MTFPNTSDVIVRVFDKELLSSIMTAVGREDGFIQENEFITYQGFREIDENTLEFEGTYSYVKHS